MDEFDKILDDLNVFDCKLVEMVLAKTRNAGSYICLETALEFLLPYRNRLVKTLLRELGAVRNGEEYLQSVLSLALGRLYSFKNTDAVKGVLQWKEDAWRVFVYEVTLYTMAVLLQHNRFRVFNGLVEKGLTVETYHTGKRRRTKHIDFHECHSSRIVAWNEKNQILNKDTPGETRIDALGQWVSGRLCKEAHVSFDELVRTDLLLFLRTGIDARAFMWPPRLYAYCADKLQSDMRLDEGSDEAVKRDALLQIMNRPDKNRLMRECAGLLGRLQIFCKEPWLMKARSVVERLDKAF